MNKLPLLLAVLLSACATEDRVQREIDAANYCTDVSECEDLGSYCPFGCYILVNADEADRIQSLLDAYDRQHPMQCMYDCVAVEGFECTGGQCVTVQADTGQ